jgi:hypothetical protein
MLKNEFCATVAQIDQFTALRTDLPVAVFVVVSASEDPTVPTSARAPVIFLISIFDSGSF